MPAYMKLASKTLMFIPHWETFNKSQANCAFICSSWKLLSWLWVRVVWLKIGDSHVAWYANPA